MGLFDSFSSAGPSQGLQMNGSPFMQNGVNIFDENNRSMNNSFTNAWVPERSESPAPYTRYATHLFDNYDGNNENIEDGAGFMNTPEVEADRENEDADSFRHF
ncbi:hypothetical protein ONS95_010627 [Cadophora gregata]|uniref:uncharacterized protein n=1 Tax=Cadophora gregata TaxID=51156 RepID=UPI0026DD5A39|nr:uncharacterized protein ONS95_010627 [Cadophora gregata]KAK0122387.1 hypothetical protein ONS95_010627 [Cadophora gregata]KAK0127866.1 hypothetical protein ONS96_007367 [Cadophora gregata f. sp. sojae]